MLSAKEIRIFPAIAVTMPISDDQSPVASLLVFPKGRAVSKKLYGKGEDDVKAGAEEGSLIIRGTSTGVDVVQSWLLSALFWDRHGRFFKLEKGRERHAFGRDGIVRGTTGGINSAGEVERWCRVLIQPIMYTILRFKL